MTDSRLRKLLLLAERDVEQAEIELVPLYEDLCMVYEPDHEKTREIGDLLARLRHSSWRRAPPVEAARRTG